MKHEPGHAYESEVDAMIRKLRQDPRIEAERQRNWAHWWQADTTRRRDATTVDDDASGVAHNERDMAYAARRADPQGGRG